MVILESLPLWAVYVLTVLLVLAFAEIGFRIGMRTFYSEPSEEQSPMMTAVVGGMLGLMAFLLAFSTGIVVNQHGERKMMVITEANAVGTAYLRAGFLDEPDQTTVRDLLQEYVEVRLTAAFDLSQYEKAVARSEEIHGELWSIVEETVARGKESAIAALFAESINAVIDVHGLRLFSGHLRLPRLLGVVLYTATMLSFLMVGIASSHDRTRNTVGILLFALAFVAVLMVIVDLDRPQQGLLNVSQESLEDLLQQMTTASQ